MNVTGAVWRKSTYSAQNGGDCVEIASVWRKSSYSNQNGGQCVEIASAWRTSSHSTQNGGDCVEVAGADRAVLVRDSKDPAGPRLAFAAPGWRTFLTTLHS